MRWRRRSGVRRRFFANHRRDFAISREPFANQRNGFAGSQNHFPILRNHFVILRNGFPRLGNRFLRLKLPSQGVGGISQYNKMILLTCKIISQGWKRVSSYCGTTALVCEIVWRYCKTAAQERSGPATSVHVPKSSARRTQLFLFEAKGCLSFRRAKDAKAAKSVGLASL